MKLHLALCSFKAAKYACEHFHYSQAVPAGKLVKIGVWEDDKFIGAIIFGRGANNNMLKPYGLTPEQGCELVRIALTDHKTPVTKLVKIALKLLQNHSPGLKLVVSYADSRQNHLGTIYQAGNWLYTGIAKTTPDYLYKGRWCHMRTLNAAVANGTITREYRDSLPQRDGGYRHRYLYPLDSSLRKELELQSKQYPKNMRDEHESNVSDSQSEEAGAVPSISHQNQSEGINERGNHANTSKN